MLGVSLLQCSEVFAIGKSIVEGVLRDIVHAINLQFFHEILFPKEIGYRAQCKIFLIFVGY